MDPRFDDPEAFWGEVLSRDLERVRRALEALPLDERREVIVHLQRMAGEPGWSSQQRESALSALAALPSPNSRDRSEQ